MSNAFITVTGLKTAFVNAGFTGSFAAKRILWNFPDATSLQIKSVSFPGSLLAPNAAGNFTYGNIYGTVVVASANPANVEFYSAPWQLDCTGACPCGGRLKFVELITEPIAAREVLASMGLPTDLPPIARATSPDIYQDSFATDWD